MSASAEQPDLAAPMDAYLAQLLREAREEVLHADAKASILLAALSVGIGATLGGVIASQWTPFDLSNDVEWMWWIGAALFAVSIISSASSVWPRYESRGDKERPIYFWGDTEGLANATELLDALKERPPDLEERGADQFLKLSSIVIAKYSLIRRALRTAGVGAVLCAAAVLLNAL